MRRCSSRDESSVATPREAISAGPITVELLRRKRSSHGPVEYRIKIKALRWSSEVWHRYSDFEMLHAALVSRASAKGTCRPGPLPPPRGLKGRCKLGSADAKEDALRTYLLDLVQRDPLVSASPLRRFLKLPEATQESTRWIPNLAVVEEEKEEEPFVCDVDVCLNASCLKASCLSSTCSTTASVEVSLLDLTDSFAE